MSPISLVGAASYMPRRIVDNRFFQIEENEEVHVMFRGVKLRHHVSKDETAAFMIDQAARKLADRLNLNLQKDVDVLLTNVTLPDQPFTGCGAIVCHGLGIRPKWVLDAHNGGCVSFLYMIGWAKAIMATYGAKTALVANVQNAGGRLFSQEQNRYRKQARIPGDGCGVGYLVANDESPVRSIDFRTYGEYAADMNAIRDDGVPWYEPSTHSGYVDFTEAKIADIMARANRMVPEVIKSTCKQAELPLDAIDVFITNQPNRIFLRNWREAVQVRPEQHVQTFERHGNLFGAGLPICLEEAVETGRLQPGHHLVFGGFSHAGDYAAAAVVHWKPGGN